MQHVARVAVQDTAAQKLPVGHVHRVGELVVFQVLVLNVEEKVVILVPLVKDMLT